MLSGGFEIRGWDAAYPGGKFLHRAAITVGALVIYRLGCYLPLPELNTKMLSDLYGSSAISFGRPIERVSIFALGVSPIFTALILAELFRLSPRFRRWEDANIRFVSRTILIATLVFAALQAFAIAMALESIGTFVTDPGWMFRFYIIATLVAATAFLNWLGGVIDRFGLGNGFWLLLALPTLVTLPEAVLAAQHGASFAKYGGTQLALIAAYVIGGLAVVTAASRANPDINRDGALLWPVILSYTLLSWLLAAFILGLPGTAEQTAMILQPQHPLNVLVFAVLVPLIAWGRARSRDSAAPARVIALAATAIALPGYLLGHFATIPFALNGQWLILLTTLALGVLSAYRQSREESAEG